MSGSDFSRRDGETGAAWRARLLALATAGWSAADRQQHQEAVRRAGWFAQAEASDPGPAGAEAPPAEGLTPLQRVQDDCRRLTAEERRQLRDWLARQQ